MHTHLMCIIMIVLAWEYIHSVATASHQYNTSFQAEKEKKHGRMNPRIHHKYGQEMWSNLLQFRIPWRLCVVQLRHQKYNNNTNTETMESHKHTHTKYFTPLFALYRKEHMVSCYLSRMACVSSNKTQSRMSVCVLLLYFQHFAMYSVAFIGCNYGFMYHIRRYLSKISVFVCVILYDGAAWVFRRRSQMHTTNQSPSVCFLSPSVGGNFVSRPFVCVSMPSGRISLQICLCLVLSAVPKSLALSV